MSKRIGWIDIAKGIGILFVVLGHTGLSGFPSKWIWSFHMPLFFFISGLLFDTSAEISFKKFVFKRIRTLLLPYLLFTLIILPFWLYKSRSFDFGIDVFLTGWVGLALWFVPVLFVSECISFLFSLRCKTILFQISFIVFNGASAYLLYNSNIRLPYKIDVVFGALFFYWLAIISKKYIFYATEKLPKSTVLLLSLASIFLSVIITYFNPSTLDMASNSVGNIGITFFAAFIGSIAVIGVSSLFQSLTTVGIIRKALIFLGTNTFVILALHQTIAQIIIEINNYMGHPIISAIRFLLLWISLYFTIMLFDKHFPFIIIIKKNNKCS